MAATGTRNGLDELLPQGALPCVWMAAGLVAYKLCDRDLDCDGCPFDRAFRRMEAAGSSTPSGPACSTPADPQTP
jgi:hypothetical protein